MEGYNSSIESVRECEFPGLSGVAYLDHAGATIYAQSQLAQVHQDLRSNIYGNPHSPCASSRLSTDTIEQVRYRILQHFNTSPECHSVIFTAGCTAALKLLADNFDWASQNTPSPKEEKASQEKPSHQGRELDPDEAEASDVDGSSHQCTSRHAEPRDHSKSAKPNGAGLFCYLSDNHTSVVGMREIARAKGADVVCIAYEDIREGAAVQASRFPVNGGRRNGLFAYPAQSNFSGAKYPLDLLRSVKRLSADSRQAICWTVVLDAASLVSTSPLDLSACKADFVALSFYKIFGFPTGLGALIVRNDAAQYLRKTYFGGGTVRAYLASRQFSVPKSSLSDQFEDGTLPFLDIIALKHGFDAVEKLAGNARSISDHTFSLAKYVHHTLASYRHANGRPVATLYCDNDFESQELQGPIVNFLLLRASGEFIGYAQIERLASLHGIHLRTGCFCNTGACQRHLGLKDEQILQNFQAGHTCGDEMDVIGGQPTGSVRVSFGYMSTFADADTFLSFVRECFIEGVDGQGPGPQSTISPDTEVTRFSPRKKSSLGEDGPPLTVITREAEPSCLTEAEVKQGGQPNAGTAVSSAKKLTPSPGGRVLTNIYLYPVKSCGAFEVGEWEIGPKGLLYDRHWMVVNDNGVCLSQKREERLCLIKPTVDLGNRCLWLHCQGQSTIAVPLDIGSGTSQDQVSKNYIQSKVCLDRVNTLDCGDRVAKWLSAALRRPCRLLQQNLEFNRNCKLAKDTTDGSNSSRQQGLSLVNESPFTLLCRPSAKSLLSAIGERIHPTAAQPIRDPPPRDAGLPRPIPASGEKGAESDMLIEQLIGRFRGNLVVDGLGAFDEDDWKSLQIGSHVFTVPGVCIRCQMVCVDQNTAQRGREPLLTLSTFRGKKVPFGIHLLRDEASSRGTTLSVGDNLSILQAQ